MVERRDERAPAPPWRAGARFAGRGKPPLTQAAIVAVALDLVELAGVEAVSMRTVAKALATGPSSIYRHVAGKDALLALVLDHVLGAVRTPAPDPEDWRAPVRDLAYEMRRVLLAHGDIAAVALSGRRVGDQPERMTDGLLSVLRAAGFPDPVCAVVADRLSLYVTADALGVARRRFAVPVSVSTDRDRAETERFTLGLDLILDGLAARRPRAIPKRQRRRPDPEASALARTDPARAPRATGKS